MTNPFRTTSDLDRDTTLSREIRGPVRTAVVGGGHLGRIHAKLLSKRSDTRVVAVCDPYAPSRDWITENLSLPVVEDYKSLLGCVDAVLIATPTTLHFPIAEWCLRNGIHVFIEKPITTSVEEATELNRLGAVHDCTIQVGHVERFNPIWVNVGRQVNQASVRHIESCREGVYTGRSTDIGIVLDLMIHDLDLILSLVSSPLQSIRAHGRCVLGAHEDFAIADLVFRNGTTAHLRASRIAPSASRTMEIHCDDDWYSLDFSKGSYTCTHATEDVASGHLQADNLPVEERLKVKDELFSRWLTQQTVAPESCNAIELEHSDFLEAVRTGRVPRVSGADGARALQVACVITDQIAEQHSAARGIIPAARLAEARRRAG